jgi:hypothetical protein
VIVVALIVIVAALWVIGINNGAKNPAGSGNTITPANTGGTHHHHAGGNGRGTRTNTQTSSTTTSTNTTTTPKNAVLTLVPTATVWICVENQAGKPLMTARDFTVGETIPTFRARQILMTLGNAGVTMTANGRPYTPTTPAGSAAIALRITPTGVKPLSSAPTCGQ